MDWDDLRIFLAAVRAGSLAKAAEELGASPSTVSRRLANLEEKLARSLLVRTPDGVRVTTAGQSLLRAAQEMERSFRAAEGEMVDGDHEITGRVRLATPIEIARRLVTPLLDRLFARHPNLEIELIPSTRPMDLARWEADLALRTFRPTTDPELVFVKLREDPWGIYARRDSMLAALSGSDAIARAPWITWSEDLAQLPEAKWLARNASTARIVVRSNDLGVMEAAATRGLGLCLLPRPFASRVQELVELALPGDWDRPISPLFLAAHGSVRNTPKVAAVWRFLEDQLRPGADPMLARTVAISVDS